MIQYLAVFEKEENLPAVVEQYYQNEACDLSRLGLHLVRAWEHKNRDLYNRLMEEKKIKYICKLLNPHRMTLAEYQKDGAYDYDSLPLEPARWRGECERELRFLHTYNDVEVQDKYPLSGDGTLDIWAPAEIRIGLEYVSLLAEAGEYERALTVLEDAAGLIERAAAFADPQEYRRGYSKEKCPAVPCRAPDLSHVRALRALNYLTLPPEIKDVKFLISFQTVSAAGHSCDYWIDVLDVDYYISVLCNRNDRPRERFCSRWLDPIRDHKRYTAVEERIRACREKLTASPQNL